MKATLLILIATFPLVGCQSHNPKEMAASNFGYTYDLLAPPPGVDHRVAKWANLTPTTAPPADIAPGPPESPDVGVITFYQAPGTPPKTNTPRIFVPAQRPPVRPAPAQQQVPVQPYGPQGYYQPYPSSGYDGYGGGYGYEYPSGYDSGGSAYAYSDNTVIYDGNPVYNPNTSYGPNNGQSYGPDGRTNNPPRWHRWPTNGPPRGNPRPGTFNPVPGATNTGFIPRFIPPQPGEPPGTELIDQRPFGEPPGTQFIQRYGQGEPPGTGFINNPPDSQPPMQQQPLAPRSGQPFAPAIGAPGQFRPGPPAINYPAPPPRPQQQFQPVLPGAVPIPQNRVHSGGGGGNPNPPRAQPPPPPASPRK